MRRLRFSLRLLVLVVTAVVLLVGASQYRRRSVLILCADLKDDGYVFSIPNDWQDKVWQRKPTAATIQIVQNQEVLVRLENRGGSNMVVPELNPKEIKRLKDLGVIKYSKGIP